MQSIPKVSPQRIGVFPAERMSEYGDQAGVITYFPLNQVRTLVLQSLDCLKMFHLGIPVFDERLL